MGKPLGGDKIKLVGDQGHEVLEGETGEIWCKGPCCSSGFYQDIEATNKIWTPDGWYKTGDLGKFDDDGNLKIVGRKKDMIIRGGQNIYPAEIESILIGHPKIENVAVIGFPDSLLGERACACVVVKKGEVFSLEEMVDFFQKKAIAMYKIPERIEILTSIPLAGEQKADKKRLREFICSNLK